VRFRLVLERPLVKDVQEAMFQPVLVRVLTLASVDALKVRMVDGELPPCQWAFNPLGD